ncbi:MAG TPA: four helix bundle protein [Thermoanaerobaculia bacterium]|nr:four helix bundle protein [Thermoanaerobaculia bacterium]
MSKTFEDLRAFQRALDLMVDVYAATEPMPKSDLRPHLRRAAGSVVSHIAEGQGRLTNAEWSQALSAARGSLYVVQAHVIAAAKLDILTPGVAEHLKKSARHAARELDGLIVWVRRHGGEKRS